VPYPKLELSVPLPIVDRAKGRNQEAQARVGIAGLDQASVEPGLLRPWGTGSQRYRTAIEEVTS